jgi:3-methyladenine DNA glycosylase/8-oxoguanine DNA glycosylase
MKRPIALQFKHVVELHPPAPFNFDATLYNPSHFPTADNEWQPGMRWQTLLWQKQRLGLKFKNQGTVDSPRVTLSIWSKEKLDRQFVKRLMDEITYRYNLQLELTDFNRRFENDPQMGPIIDRWRGMRPWNYNSLYEYLIIAIVLQNATVQRTVQMMQALYERYGTWLAYDGKKLACFWEPSIVDRATEQELRDLKVGYRAKSIKRVTAAFAHGEINELELRNKSREEQREALLALYGIGPASVGYILGDVFHHMDEMNHISPWERKIYSKLFFDVSPDEPVPTDTLLAFFDKHFGQYKMLAVHYVWSDLFWRRKHEPVEWLEKLIRL